MILSFLKCPYYVSGAGHYVFSSVRFSPVCLSFINVSVERARPELQSLMGMCVLGVCVKECLDELAASEHCITGLRNSFDFHPLNHGVQFSQIMNSSSFLCL